MTSDIPAFDHAVDELLGTMEAMAQASRAWHPDSAPMIVEALLTWHGTLAHALQAFTAREGPAATAPAPLRAACTAAAATLLEAFDALESTDPMEAYRHLRANVLAQELLYPAAGLHSEVSRFFLAAEYRDDAALLGRLRQPLPGTGVAHFANERDQRGGFSLYVPEAIEIGVRLPLVIALHGGSGHGHDFVWTWLKAARARSAMVLSPTSIGRTWALQTPDVDSQNIVAMLDQLITRYPIDPARVLLTGMSDGGTFAAICGVLGLLPATHIAPISSSFSPRLLELASPERLASRPIYLVHGEHDWMFPVDRARAARAALEAHGARVVYREVADLGHAYPREETPRILDWFMA
ncbi:MAG: phospholipase [Dehalococcoidia bacterium]|nr:phospholipase [Dehalococcoidia bacterium]